jgi:hypothetical protein
LVNPKILRLEPSLASERKLIELPRCKKSKTLTPEAKRAIPYSDMVDPHLAKLLIDKLDPRVKKSSIDKLEPNWLNPYTDNVLPMRMKLRILRLDPRLKKSRTLKEDPNFAYP